MIVNDPKVATVGTNVRILIEQGGFNRAVFGEDVEAEIINEVLGMPQVLVFQWVGGKCRVISGRQQPRIRQPQSPLRNRWGQLK